MQALDFVIHPIIRVTKSKDPSDLRLEHAKKAMSAVAKTIRDLFTVIPIAFLQGAVGGALFMSGAIGISAALVSTGGSLVEALQVITSYSGYTMIALTCLPSLTTGSKKVAYHMMWVWNPKGMEEEALKRLTAKTSKVIAISLVACACLAVSWTIAPNDFLGLGKRFSTVNG